MKVKEAKELLAKELNALLWKHDVDSVDDYADTKEELKDWIDDLDFFVYATPIPDDLDGIKINFYGVSSNDGEDYLGRVIIGKDKEVIAYGYTHD